MAQYTTHNRQAGTQQVVTSTFKTAVNLSAATATLRRAFITEFMVGADEAPVAADCAMTWDLSRQSTIGTGTTATPSPIDNADAAAGTVSTVNMTAEPTTGVSVLAFPLNQRNSQRWVAKDDKSRLVIPATNLAGIGVRVLSALYTNKPLAEVTFEE